MKVDVSGPRGTIPHPIKINDGALYDVSVPNYMPPEAGAFYVVDRDYCDIAQFF